MSTPNKTAWPQAVIDHFVREAQHGGSGREKNIGGGNTSVELTIFAVDLVDSVGAVAATAFSAYVGGTARIVLNALGKPIGWKFSRRKHHI